VVRYMGALFSFCYKWFTETTLVMWELYLYHGEGNETAFLRPVRLPRVMTMPLQPLSRWKILEAKTLALTTVQTNRQH
jgi:hypothetical protein